ncbi:MAG: response regulator transcription factor [Epsilonproteobacteria bacterium]|nr:response regulator transcription factor [Campylobacterota bacterium]
MNALIVLIEDEEDLLELMEYRLQKEGFETEGFLSTKNVEPFLAEEEVDLMIVDRNLPGIEGSDFVKMLRDKGFITPVIFVTAKANENDIEEGFERGGDDYITKPFNMNELSLRVKAILKRTKSITEGKISYRDIVLDLSTRTAYVAKNEVNLTKLEFNLLACFIKHKNSVLDRDFLLEYVWADEFEVKQEKTVNVTINRLKKKIDPDKEKNYIKSIRGVGYQIC